MILHVKMANKFDIRLFQYFTEVRNVMTVSSHFLNKFKLLQRKVTVIFGHSIQRATTSDISVLVTSLVAV